MNHPSDTNSIIGPVASGPVEPASWSAMSLLAERNVFRLLTAIRSGRRYVLKTLREPYASNPAYVAMLEREAALAVRLDHRGVVRVEGMETIPGAGRCLVMEWVDGRTLAQFLAESIAVAERRRIALELAEALAYLHEVDTAHRDLKPDNVMITRRGNHVKIIDFGLGDAPDAVAGKSSRATAFYGAPEQLAEAATAAGPEADVWSFGRMLSELRCGRRYDRIAASCMRENPTDRPTMSQVVARLTAGGQSRRQWLWVAIAFSALIVIIGVVIMLLRKTSDAEAPAISAPGSAAVDTIQPVATPPAPTPEALPHETPRPQPSSAPTDSIAIKKIMAEAVAELQAIYDEQSRFYSNPDLRDMDMKTNIEKSTAIEEQTKTAISAVYTRFEKRLRAAGITDNDYYPLLSDLSATQLRIQEAAIAKTATLIQ